MEVKYEGFLQVLSVCVCVCVISLHIHTSGQKFGIIYIYTEKNWSRIYLKKATELFLSENASKCSKICQVKT